MFLCCLLWPAQPLLSSEFRDEQDESTSLQCTLQCKLTLLHPNVIMLLLTGCQKLFSCPDLGLSLIPGQSGQKCVPSGRWPQASSQPPSTGLEQGARKQKISSFQTGIRE